MNTSISAPEHPDVALAPRPAKRRPLLNRTDPSWFLVPAVAVIIVTAWESATRVFDIKDYILPPPSAIADALFTMVQTSTFWENFRYTAIEAGLGFVLASVLAMILAILVTQFRLVDIAVFPYVVMLETVPKVALAPLFVIWFGFGMSAKVITAATVCFFPILLNMIQGLRSTQTEKLELMKSLRAGRIETFRRVIFPEALPSIFTGLNLGVIFAVIGAVVAEFVGARAGLGNQLLQYNYEFNIASSFACIIVLSILGLTGHFCVRFAQRRFAFWASAATR